MLSIRGAQWLWLAAFSLLPASIDAGEALPPWKGEWEKLVKAAEKEGEIRIFGSDSHQEAAQAFQKVFPKIKVRFEPGAGRDFAPRVMAERRAGKYLVDITMLGSATQFGVFYKAGVLDPIPPALFLPEVTDLSKWWQGRHHYADPEGKYIFINQGSVSATLVAYNSNVVDPKELKSHADLLSPKWKGKIVAWDPKRPGQIQNLKGLYFNPLLGPGFITKFYGENDVTLGGDARLIIDWLAKGKYLLYFMARDRDIEEAKKQGLPVDLVDAPPRESYLSSAMGNIALFNKAPHPQAARLYLNWLFSRDGQIQWQKATDANSLRTDISKEAISHWQSVVPKEGVEYILTSLPQYSDVAPIVKVVDEALARKEKVKGQK